MPGALAHLTRTVLALLLAHDDKGDSSASLELQTHFSSVQTPNSTSEILTGGRGTMSGLQSHVGKATEEQGFTRGQLSCW